MDLIKNKVKAVIFDMDGTILKTEDAWEKAVVNALQSLGVSSYTSEEENLLRSFSGVALHVCSKVMKKEFNLIEPPESIVKEIQKSAYKIFDRGLEFMDGFEDFHCKLKKANVPTSIATSADQMSLNRLSKQMNLPSFFGANLYSIESIGNIAKPSPDIFLHAAKQLNVSPEDCIVFEDSLVGFQAASAAGMKCIAIKNSSNKKSLSLANHAIESYSEAEHAISKILK